jgi:chemotaxis regulatin CheY-phosphate phosphatase CheZ
VGLLFLGYFGLLRAFFRILNVILKNLDKALVEMENAMKKIAQASEDMSYIIAMFAYDLPQTLDEIKLAAKEFERLGRDFNKIAEVLIGRSNDRNIEKPFRNKSQIKTIRGYSTMTGEKIIRSTNIENDRVNDLATMTAELASKVTKKTSSTWIQGKGLATLMTRDLIENIMGRVKLAKELSFMRNRNSVEWWTKKWIIIAEKIPILIIEFKLASYVGPEKFSINNTRLEPYSILDRNPEIEVKTALIHVQKIRIIKPRLIQISWNSFEDKSRIEDLVGVNYLMERMFFTRGSKIFVDEKNCKLIF